MAASITMFTPKILFAVLRALHIAAGCVALVAGLGAMLSAKGALWHRRHGRAYFWSMALIFATAVVMGLMHQRAFLLIVAPFSFYLCFAGYRAPRVRKPGRSAQVLDYAAAVIGLGSVAAFVVWSLGEPGSLRIVARVFGGILLLIAGVDLYRFLRPSSDRFAWRYAHMVRMLGAYIATTTAFAVVNLKFLPPLLVWITPTVVGTVGIAVWVTYYRVQDARRATARAVAG